MALRFAGFRRRDMALMNSFILVTQKTWLLHGDDNEGIRWRTLTVPELSRDRLFHPRT